MIGRIDLDLAGGRVKHDDPLTASSGYAAWVSISLESTCRSRDSSPYLYVTTILVRHTYPQVVACGPADV